MKQVIPEVEPVLKPLEKLLEEQKTLELRVLGRQAVDIGIIPENFCDEDPKILELFGIE